MKRSLVLILVLVMVMAVTACDKGGDSGSGSNGGTDGATKTDNGGSTTQAASTGTCPRVTYYDGKDGKKYAASLQNAHLKYEYGEDRSDGKGVVSYTFEFLNYEYTSSLSSRVEVTLYEVGKVTPSDVKAKVNELLSGHESEFKHMTFDEYRKIFE